MVYLSFSFFLACHLNLILCLRMRLQIILNVHLIKSFLRHQITDQSFIRQINLSRDFSHLRISLLQISRLIHLIILINLIILLHLIPLQNRLLLRQISFGTIPH
jgi:hypothetical protein